MVTMIKHFWANDGWWMLRMGGAGPANDAECDHEGKIISLKQGHGVMGDVSCLLHEVAHASCPYLTEDAVLNLEEAQMNALQAYLDMHSLELTPKRAAWTALPVKPTTP